MQLTCAPPTGLGPGPGRGVVNGACSGSGECCADNVASALAIDSLAKIHSYSRNMTPCGVNLHPYGNHCSIYLVLLNVKICHIIVYYHYNLYFLHFTYLLCPDCFFLT